MPALIWLAPPGGKPYRQEIAALVKSLESRGIPVEKYRYVAVVSQSPSPRRIARLLAAAARKAGKVYVVASLPPGLLSSILTEAEKLAPGKIVFMVPEIEVTATTPASSPPVPRFPFHVLCYDGSCIVYRIRGFREVYGVQLYTKNYIPLQLYA